MGSCKSAKKVISTGWGKKSMCVGEGDTEQTLSTKKDK